MVKKIKKVVKRKAGITIKKKDFALTNKSRKGAYYYVKEPKKVGKYYKVKEGLSEEDYIDYYKRGIISKRGGVSKEKLTRERKLDLKSKKYPHIEQSLGKGYYEYRIKNGKRLSPYGISNAYKFLLTNKDKMGDKLGIVRDDELVDILTRSENIEKWKHRILFEVIIKNEKDEIMSTINNTKIVTLAELKRDVIDKLRVGMEFGEFSKAIGGSSIEKDGYVVNAGTSREGRLKSINVRMIYRKGSASRKK